MIHENHSYRYIINIINKSLGVMLKWVLGCGVNYYRIIIIFLSEIDSEIICLLTFAYSRPRRLYFKRFVISVWDI